MYTPMVFKVPPGGSIWIGLRLCIKLLPPPPRTEMVVKTRPIFMRRGLTVGNPIPCWIVLGMGSNPNLC